MKAEDDRQQRGKSVEDFIHELRYKLRNVPPNSRFSLEIVTNGSGEIHNHRYALTEDRGPLILN